MNNIFQLNACNYLFKLWILIKTNLVHRKNPPPQKKELIKITPFPQLDYLVYPSSPHKIIKPLEIFPFLGLLLNVTEKLIECY